MKFFVPEDKVTEIRNATDIFDIVSEVVSLKKAGKNHVGLCPFHSEKTPSFTVDTDKQMFYCFGCHTGGDVFTFVVKHEGISFPEAVKSLAGRYGIEIPTPTMSGSQKKRLSDREKIMAVNKLAGEFFIHALHQTPRGRRCMEYLTNRGMTKDIIDRFGIGYAPGGWDRLLGYLKKKHVPLKVAEMSGLIVDNKKGGFYDRFRERVVFPIYDMGKNVIGFGGRVMDDGMPKYLNSPETLVYNKSRSLYGLHLTKQWIRKEGTVFIVEGYLDMLSLFQHHIQNVVATLGTALTPDHVKILRGHTTKVILVYDSDEAGIKAAKRSIQVFKHGHMDARILVLPEGHDPDSFVVSFGGEAFNDLAGKAVGAMEFLIADAVNKYGLSIEGKVRIISELKENLAEIDDGVTRSLYIKALSEKLGVDQLAILEKVKGVLAGKKGKRFLKGEMHQQQHQHDLAKPSKMAFSKLERQIIAMMLQYPKIFSEIREKQVLEYFESDMLKEIGMLILSEGEDHFSVPDILTKAVDSEMRQVISSLSIGDAPWDIKGCCNIINQFVFRRADRKTNLLNKIKAAEARNDHERLFTLLREKQLQVNKKSRCTKEANLYGKKIC